MSLKPQPAKQTHYALLKHVQHLDCSHVHAETFDVEKKSVNSNTKRENTEFQAE